MREFATEPESPASPPLHEQGSNITGYNQAGLNVTIEHCQLNCHIQGISVRVSRKCKESNLDNYGDCEECGNSYLHIREISDLNFLESTATSKKTYNERQRRREAILYRNGDREGSLWTWGLWQAAACDGFYYQIPAHGDNTNQLPGTLPLWEYGPSVYLDPAIRSLYNLAPIRWYYFLLLIVLFRVYSFVVKSANMM